MERTKTAFSRRVSAGLTDDPSSHPSATEQDHRRGPEITTPPVQRVKVRRAIAGLVVSGREMGV